MWNAPEITIFVAEIVQHETLFCCDIEWLGQSVLNIFIKIIKYSVSEKDVHAQG
jgi:hypothetical protein